MVIGAIDQQEAQLDCTMSFSCWHNATSVSLFMLLANGSVFGKRDLLAIGHIMLALFWSYVPNMK